MEEDQDNTVIGSTFPPPPPHHLKFTSHNLRLLALLQAASTSPASPSTDRKGKQREILADESDVPEWDLETELVPPRVDWVEEDGGYECYGAFYPIPARVADVEEMGVKRLIPKDTADPKPHLLTLLHSLLHTNLLLLSALTRPPPPPPQSEEEEQSYRTVAGPYVDRMAEIGVNMVAGVNNLRGVQARVNLEQLMKSQLERRREETAAVKRKCSELSETLAGLRASLSAAALVDASTMEVDDLSAPPPPPPLQDELFDAEASLAQDAARTRREQELWASLDDI